MTDPITSPLHRDEFPGVDQDGALHGATAVDRLLNSTPPGPDWNGGAPTNPWAAADLAVEQADQRTKDAALRRLLALHMYDVTNVHPQVSMRNVRPGDIVGVSDVPRRVLERTGLGDHNTTVTISVIPEHADRETTTPGLVAYDGDVHLSLLHRISQTQGQKLFTEIVDAHQNADSAYRRGLERAFLLMTGEDAETLHEQVQEALQARHEEQIGAEELY